MTNDLAATDVDKAIGWLRKSLGYRATAGMDLIYLERIIAALSASQARYEEMEKKHAAYVIDARDCVNYHNEVQAAQHTIILKYKDDNATLRAELIKSNQQGLDYAALAGRKERELADVRAKAVEFARAMLETVTEDKDGWRLAYTRDTDDAAEYLLSLGLVGKHSERDWYRFIQQPKVQGGK